MEPWLHFRWGCWQGARTSYLTKAFLTRDSKSTRHRKFKFFSWNGWSCSVLLPIFTTGMWGLIRSGDRQFETLPLSTTNIYTTGWVCQICVPSPGWTITTQMQPNPFLQIVKGKIRDLLVNGPDTKTNNHYTYQGNLVTTNGGGGGGGNSHHHQRTGYRGGFIARDDTASSRPTIEKFELSNAITSQWWLWPRKRLRELETFDLVISYYCMRVFKKDDWCLINYVCKILCQKDNSWLREPVWDNAALQ